MTVPPTTIIIDCDDKIGSDQIISDCTRRCPATFLPVCGSNGQTYSNECNLRFLCFWWHYRRSLIVWHLSETIVKWNSLISHVDIFPKDINLNINISINIRHNTNTKNTNIGHNTNIDNILSQQRCLFFSGPLSQTYRHMSGTTGW